MIMQLPSASLAAASAIALSAGYYLVTVWRLQRKTKALGCKPVPVWRVWDLFGANMTWTMIKAMNENRMSEQLHTILKEVQEREGRQLKTFQVAFPPGLLHFFTFDPRNVQAVLATQFKDFRIPVGRLAGFRQLLGQGIVSYSYRDSLNCLTTTVLV